MRVHEIKSVLQDFVGVIFPRTVAYVFDPKLLILIAPPFENYLYFKVLFSPLFAIFRYNAPANSK